MATNSYWYYTLGFTWARMGVAEKLDVPDATPDQIALALGVHDGKGRDEPRSHPELEQRVQYLSTSS